MTTANNTPTPSPEDPLTAEDAARLLRCEVGTVEEWLRDGRLVGLKLGRSWVLPRGAFFRRLDELAIEQAARRRTGDQGLATTTTPPASSPRRRAARPLPQLVEVRR